MKKKINKSQYYLGEETLPTPQAEFEYTPKMIKEMKKCAENITHFATNYFYITTIERGKEVIKLYWPQKRILKALDKHRFNVILASRQIGKCVCSDTKIKIRNKKTKKIEEIEINRFFERIKNNQT
jgi:hypothetical protein